MLKIVNSLRRINVYVILVFICLISFALMFWAAWGDSANFDEKAHIPAGYGYVRNLDYRLNPEHPPLVKAIAAIPLLFVNPQFPVNDPAWTSEVNGQWDMGMKFLYESGNNADMIIRLSRIGPILLTILLVILIYIMAAELLGKWWSLLPAFLFALSPTVLAHGHYVTTDVGAAFGVVLGTYFFIKYLLAPSKKQLIYAGLTFGVAMLAKFSTVLLIPLFVFLIIVFYIVSVIRDWRNTEPRLRFKRFSIRIFKYIRSLIVLFAIGYLLIVYPVYFLFTLHYPQAKQTSDTETILSSFAGEPTPAGEVCNPKRCLADLNIGMTKHQITRPLGEYFLGVLTALQRSEGGNGNYFLGYVSSSGSHWYFPILLLLKEPIPVLIMIFLALILSITGIIKAIARRRTRFWDYLETSFPEFSMISFVIFYWAYSIQSPLNIGYRHLLPVMPFTYILTASALKRWTFQFNSKNIASVMNLMLAKMRNIFTSVFKLVFIFVLLLWLIIEVAIVSPYYLSYFNEFAGGTWNGYRFATDSNYDWGQDLIRLQQWVNAHPEADKIAVDYFGGGDPKYYLGAREENWWSAKGNPSETQTNADYPQTNAETAANSQRESALSQRKSAIGWFAVSANVLQGSVEPKAPTETRGPEDEYRWLTDLRPPKGLWNVPQPDYRVGTSIFVYKL